MPPMNRREALKVSTVLLGGVLVTSAGVLAGCASERPEPRDATSRVLSPDDQALVEEIADTILPATPSSPGAKAAGAGAAINLLLTDCRSTDEQQRVVSGLQDFRSACRERCGGDFTALAPRERERFVRAIDAEARTAGETHYFGLVRDLASQAYFSSEIGLTRALRYVRVPGRWEGCVPLAPGQRAWG